MDSTNAQRQARWRQRQKTRSAELTQARARIAELESALKQQAQRDAPTDRDSKERSELRMEIISLRRALNQAEGALKRMQAAAAAKSPRAPKPPVDPDSEVARLKTANKNLRNNLAHVTRWHEQEMRRNGKMPLPTVRAIAKCLHPDHTPSEDEREHACKLFNVFTDSQKGK